LVHSLSSLIYRHINEILNEWLSTYEMEQFFQKYGIESDYFFTRYAFPLLKTISLEGEISFSGRSLVDYLISRDVILVDFDQLFSSYRQVVISFALKQENWLPDEINTLLRTNDSHRQQVTKYYSDALLLGSEKSKKELVRFRQYQKVLDKGAIVSKTDSRGIITYVNEAFCAISGYTKSELIGKPHNIVRHPDSDAKIFKELWRTIQAKKVFKGIIKNRKKSGEAYYVDATIVPILNEENKIVEYIALRYDISPLIEAVELTKKAQKVKDDFLANMSHEIRTPLNAIVGFIKILNDYIDDENGKNYITIIDDSAQMLLGIINDILDLSKLQSGKFTITAEPFNPISTLSSSIKLFQSKVKEKSLSYAVYISPNIPQCLIGDTLRITQVVSNFLSNAIKFTPHNGTIKINASYEENCLNVMVQDSGIGISFDKQRKIFEPFEQADGSITKTYGGTGLGLSISSELISQMGGELIFRSIEHKGSLFGFRLDLPLCDSDVNSITSHNNYSSLRIALLSNKSSVNKIKLITKYLQSFGIEQIDLLHEHDVADYDAVFIPASSKHIDEFVNNAKFIIILEQNSSISIIKQENILHLSEPYLPKEMESILDKIKTAKNKI
jgi:PAS domain S-box-containing protein